MVETMKKRILFIMPSMFIGGAERSLLGLLSAIDYEKYEVSLFLFRHEGDFLHLIPKQVHIIPPIAEYATFDVPIVSLLFSRQWLFGISRLLSKFFLQIHCLLSGESKGTWMSMQFTSRFLQKLLPDIPGEYDAAVSFQGIPDVLVNKVQAKKKLAWNHTDYSILGPWKSYDRKIYTKVDYIVSVSDTCTDQFLNVYPEFHAKSVTIENIMDSSLLEKQAEDSVDELFECSEIKLLSVGRYSTAKNFDNVPAICRMIREQGLDIKWFLIGYGGDENLIRTKIQEEGMQEYVQLLGKKNNPYPYIRKCDLYVQPSRYEGKAVTVREAQALCKPVVITDFATAGSQLDNGIDGVVVPIDNAGCAAGIVRLLKDPQKMEQLSQNCSMHDYSNAANIEDLYLLL